jgi:hypothetical protein
MTRKFFFLVLIAVGSISFLCLEADAKKVVSKVGRKEKIGNQHVVVAQSSRRLENEDEEKVGKFGHGPGVSREENEETGDDEDGENDKDGECSEDEECGKEDHDGDDEDGKCEEDECDKDADDGDNEDGDSEEDGDEIGGGDEDDEDENGGGDEDDENENGGGDEDLRVANLKRPPSSREVHGPPK